MPDPVLNAPGFFGKLPAAGDFVSRRLPAGFVGFWDRWISRHLVLRDAPTLCFLAPGEGAAGAMTGIALPSRDRAGRRFPLTLAAPAPGGAPAPAPWYAALGAVGAAATRGEIDADGLAVRLAALAPPPGAGGAAAGFLLWRPGQAPRAADPEAPEPVLHALLAATEAG